jgi:hypothetical protein
MALQKTPQYTAALELLKIGMTNGTIKLHGSTNSNTAVQDARCDAAYVITLLEELSAQLPAD